MSDFQLTNTVDKDKVFMVNLSEVEGRLDPFYNDVKYKETEDKIKNNNDFEYLPLKRITTKITDGAHLSPQSNSIFNNNYITVKDIGKDGQINLLNCLKISDEDYNNLIKSGCQPNVDDVLFSKDGTVGRTHHVIQNNFVVLSSLAIIRPKKERILPKYLEYILKSNLLLLFLFREMGGSAIRRLVLINLKEIKIPLPNIDIQKKIVNIYETGYTQKQQKEAEAKKLLASIDIYLLKELEISLPEKDNSLENRIFTTSLSNVSGGRFDPKLYDNNTQGIRNAINKTTFYKPRLKELITHSVAGDWGKDEKEDLGDEYKKCLVIRATEFDNRYNLKLDNSRVKYRLISKEKLDRIDIQENDLLIEKSGGSPDQPVGRISILTNDIFKNNTIGYSNFIHKIRVDSSKIIPEYLFCYLKTVHSIKLTDAMQSQTNGIRNLIMSNYFNQTIPLPKKDKQNEIANHISDIRAKAKQLEQEAKEVLDKAKQEVEQMILGA